MATIVGKVKITEQTRSTIVSQNFKPKPNVSLDEITNVSTIGVQDGYALIYSSATNLYETKPLYNVSVTNTANAAFLSANASFLVANGAAFVANTDFTGLSITAANFGTAAAVASFRVEANGRISSANNTAIAIDATAITTGTLGVTRGGTGANTAADARTALELGTIATQNSSNVAITGGSVSNTSLTVADNVFKLQDNLDPTKQAQFQLSAIGTGVTRTYTLPDNTGAIALLNNPQNWTSAQTFTAGSNVFGSSVGTSTSSLGTGATTTGLLKTVNIGTGGLSGSTTAITVGSANGSTTTMLGTTNIGGAAGNQSLQVNNVASAVNYAQIVGAATGGTPTISAQGTDANIALNILGKGTATLAIGGTAAAPSLYVAQVTSQVNSFSVFGNISGQAPTLSVVGPDANIPINIQAKGTSGISFQGNSQTIFNASNITGSDFTNYYITTGNLNYTAAGGSTNINFYYQTKGTGGYNFTTGGGQQVGITNTASAVNYLNFTGSATNSGTPANAGPTLSAAGSDANINLRLTPKGTGTLQFGTHTAGVLTPTGYITITDAAGTSRRLLVG